MEKDISFCLPPVVDDETRLLILGSLPGVRSLELKQYYGHPRNHFWPLLAGLTGVDLPALSYEARLDQLLAHRVGLWDVVAHAVRPGSLDQHMRSLHPNGLPAFAARLPRLRAIAFNGSTASRIGRGQLMADPGFTDRGIALIDLPSSSPANTRSLIDKAALWMQLSAHLQSESDDE